MKNIFGVLMIAFCLSACEAESNHLIPVGTKLPGGFVVDESLLFETLDDCKSHAEARLEERGAKVTGETSTQTLYTRALLQDNNRQALQVCTVRDSKNVSYSSAIK